MTEEPSIQLQIRDGAFELFAERGIEPVTLRMIASRAGVATGQITQLYGNKAGVVTAVDARARELCTAALDRVLESLDDVTGGDMAAVSIAQHISDLLRTGATLRRYVARRLASDSTAGRQFFEQVVVLVDTGLRRLRAAGLLQPGLDPEATRRLVVGLILAPVLLAEQWTHLTGVDSFDLSQAVPAELVMQQVLQTGLFVEKPTA